MERKTKSLFIIFFHVFLGVIHVVFLGLHYLGYLPDFDDF